MTEKTRWATEDEALAAYGLDADDVEHCGSCHSDENELGIQMGEADLPDGRIAAVCCAVNLLIDKKRGVA